MFPFYTPWKYEKTPCLLFFSGVLKWEYWLLAVVNIPFKINPSVEVIEATKYLLAQSMEFVLTERFNQDAILDAREVLDVGVTIHQ